VDREIFANGLAGLPRQNGVIWLEEVAMVNTLKPKPGGAVYNKPNQNPLSDFVIGSASDLVSKFLEAEVEEFLASYSDLTDGNGKPRMVRNGYLPERKVRTPLGRLPVKIPRVRDRIKDAGAQKIRFSSKLISPYQRRTNVRENVMNRYIVKFMAGDVLEATAAVLGNRISHATPNTVARLKEMYEKKGLHCHQGKVFKSVWVDRLPGGEAETETITPLVVAIGETEGEEKHLLFAFEDTGSNENLKQQVQRQLSELNVEGDLQIALSDSCFTA
jgi:hypothetical protein